ncbi:replication initiator protein A [Deinococcus alpinitundrae]|uniref:replication initiator protein A n=1 Tax=Deinococcus alpinitundrae TaxID=468913 RepID=UPI001379A8A2|nr:replication initiator protein A [Deinococcus alpinitundrae]
MKRFDEANVGRLGLISIQERIPSTYTSWTQDFEIEGRPASLKCVAPAEFGGVPHGLDDDIANALRQIYIDAGSPANGEFQTTAYNIIKTAGFPINGQYYRQLKESLNRLKGATYTAAESWRDARRNRWTTVSFNFIELLRYVTNVEEGAFSNSTPITIRLAEPIVQSIRANYVRPYDYEFSRSLKTSVTRAVYRLLDASRYSPHDIQRPQAILTFGLIKWAEECKINDRTPKRVRRTLDSAHDELMEQGYLKEVVYTGRGAKQMISYIFSDLTEIGTVSVLLDERPAVNALVEYGITRPAAAKLVNQFGEKRVLDRIQMFEAIFRNGKARPNNIPGYLTDVVRDDSGKYTDPRSAGGQSGDGATGTPRRSARQRAQETEEKAQQDLESRLLGSREEHVLDVMRAFRVTLKSQLKEQEFQHLESMLLTSEVDIKEFKDRIFALSFRAEAGAAAAQARNFMMRGVLDPER